MTGLILPKEKRTGQYPYPLGLFWAGDETETEVEMDSRTSFCEYKLPFMADYLPKN